MLKRIILTPKEENIVSILSHIASSIDKKPTLRIAGGWVRDKLLGLESADLDITIDNMTGEEFATQVAHYFKSQGKDLTVATISLNPAKSKHLETATARICDQMIDFVNLRAEEYTENSRNPLIRFGTPLEDALRRDITINSLFYNISSQQVEDFTGKGLQDLQKGYIRTPMEPMQTFLDDPLRVLRVIRFATRFGYEMDQDIIQAASTETIHEAFEKKISRERVGIEIEKMAMGKDPLKALEYLYQIGFYPLVFKPPHPIPVENVLQWNEPLSRSELSGKHIYLALYVASFRNTVYKQKLKNLPVPHYIISNSIKLSNADSEKVCALLVHSDRIINCLNGTRSELGFLVRDLGAVLKSDWPNAILFASILHHQPMEPFKLLIQRIHDAGLERAYDTKPLLTGTEICEICGIKPGPQIAPLTRKVLEWQFEHDGTPQECAAYLKSIYPHL